MACAAPRASLNCSSPSVELFGFTRMPITSDFGTNSRNSSSLFAPSSYVEQAHPGGISVRPAEAGHEANLDRVPHHS
jgi:hypothetical protein